MSKPVIIINKKGKAVDVTETKDGKQRLEVNPPSRSFSTIVKVQIALTTSSVMIAVANPNRKYFNIINTTGKDVEFWLGDSGNLPGMIIRSLENYEITNNNLWLGEIYARTAQGSGNLVIWEGV